ncbi:MAG: hypothetical protein HY901_06745 [Deltaproteobacteria bacterium]|nr:hypothetical protein [Deltaproteobacteria bacterium]
MRMAKALGGLLAVTAMICFAARSPAGELPIKLQVALLKKIVAYDTSLDGKALKVLVVGEPGEASNLMQAFEAAGVSASQVAPANLPRAADAGTVVFLLSAQVPVGLRDLCVGSQLLSAAPGVALAEAGEVSVGLGEKPDGRPEIVIHRSRCRDEGHQFRASLLSLARLVSSP